METKKDNLSPANIMDRVMQPKPNFFVKLQIVMASIGAAGLAIISIPASVVALPAIVITIAGYAFAVGVAGAAIAQTTKQTQGNEPLK